MKTIKEVFIIFRTQLAELYDRQEIEALTLLIINEVTHLSKATIKAFPEKPITEQQEQEIGSIIATLKTGKPIQYILGHTEFYGLNFKVNPSVLIPRPETEELVDWAVSSVQLAVSSGQWTGGLERSAVGFNVLDIGTGSGCIAISLKKNLPNSTVSAIDISPGALETAKQNAALNKVDINFLAADILDLKTLSPTKPYSLIISNPPYVTLQDKILMHKNVTDFEPHPALFVPEDDPLIFYKAIADFAANNLVTHGLLFLEINESFGPQTVELLEDKRFKNIELKRDMNDKYRMIKSVWDINS